MSKPVFRFSAKVMYFLNINVKKVYLIAYDFKDKKKILFLPKLTELENDLFF